MMDVEHLHTALGSEFSMETVLNVELITHYGNIPLFISLRVMHLDGTKAAWAVILGPDGLLSQVPLDPSDITPPITQEEYDRVVLSVLEAVRQFVEVEEEDED